MRWVALMPLRGGSKSIPGKNIRRIAGRPLFSWSLQAALASECFEHLYVATDADEIRETAAGMFGDRLTVLDRSPETASDSASTESVMLEFQDRVAFDVLCLIQATSPLTRAEDFRAAKRQFTAQDLDSLLSAVETRRFLWTKQGVPVNYDPAARPRRQDFEGLFMENGAFYFTKAGVLRERRCRLGGRIGIYAMAPETAVEIDDPSDWRIAESLLMERRAPVCTGTRLGSIRAFVVDVDGTLTDGGMYYGPAGEAMKKFNTRDAAGLRRLRERGIRVCVVTAENSPAVAARMEKLRIEDYFPGVGDKLDWLNKQCSTWKLDPDQIAYMGDDLGDLQCLRQAGAAFCPADAAPEVIRAAGYVCSRPGGAGAVREVCDLIIDALSNAAAAAQADRPARSRELPAGSALGT